MANGSQLRHEGEFSYIDVGDGPPLIFLHGLFGALSNFEGPIAHFGGRYRVLMPMLPLYTLPMLNTNVPALADFLDRFIRHKGLSAVNLLGNSLGGHVALVYCTKHADTVRTLTQMNAMKAAAAAVEAEATVARKAYDAFPDEVRKRLAELEKEAAQQ